MTETDAKPDVVDILTSDHRDMLDLLAQIEGTGDAERRRDLADTVIAEVMRHAVAEEMFVYPAIAKHLPDGEQEVEEDKREHEEIVQVMKRLEDADAAGPEFLAIARELEADLREHMAEEEADQFPRLRAHIPHDELVTMGTKVESAKKLAPTRAHPSAPHSELFHKTLGPGVGLVDRLRDALSGRNSG
ncbi:hemerythrin domain-containing protein [Cellulomonas sp. ATA003]|uniref:hemerythrin domain-containing protein n=1 Tax=Cellulomonas sp. ATA003 TaxID=3073064 RepID=UPI0028730D7F|nr:hemerythrin domain-containing protein [Cellulomonas sp. ATA003]WNB85138.1 hemerythrin domain-containing protein [Cellulomonas sp. ATA003]